MPGFNTTQGRRLLRKVPGNWPKTGDLASQRNAVNNLGLIYAAWGQYPKAVEYYEAALAIATKLGDVRGAKG